MGVDRTIDITPEQRKTVLTLLERYLPGVTAWAYGSRAKWTSRPESDFDLVVFAKPEQKNQVALLRDEFDESALPFRVELFVWDEVPKSFREQIRAEYLVLAEKNEPRTGNEWIEYILEELTENFDSLRVPVKKADRRRGPYPYYGASGIVDYIDDFIFDGEYLLVAEDGENLRTRKTPVAFLANGKFWVNNHAHILRGNRKADTRYLMYALSEIDISGYLTGSTMPKLTKNSLDRIPLFAPPPEEQRAIAHTLGTLDDKIELNRRMNETLEEMARALFKSWFVDFDPVHAKMEGRNTGLPKPIADLFPDRLIDSEIGEIPKGWSNYRLIDLADHHTRSIAPASQPEVKFEHFSIPAYDSGQMPAIEQGVEIKSNKTALPSSSVLLSKLNPEISRVWLPNRSVAGPQICSTEFLVFTPRSLSSRSLLFSLFSSRKFRTLLRSMVTGTSKSHQRVPPSALKQREVLSGMPLIFEKFNELVAPMLEGVVANRAEAQTLANLRDELLPKLISGEIRLNGAERYVEAAL